MIDALENLELAGRASDQALPSLRLRCSGEGVKP
jgi:hypothetical protein